MTYETEEREHAEPLVDTPTGLRCPKDADLLASMAANGWEHYDTVGGAYRFRRPKSYTQAPTLPSDTPARENLLAAGFTSLDDIEAATDEELLAVDDIGEARLEQLRSL